MFGEMRSAVSIPPGEDILDFIHALPEQEQREAFAKIQAIERQAMARQVAQPGLVELMEYLEVKGVRKAICTRNFEYVCLGFQPRQELIIILNSAPVKHFVENHMPKHLRPFLPIIDRDFRPPKPSPAGILHIARTWGVVKSSEESSTSPADREILPLIMVGDSVDDMAAGHAAGAFTVLLKSPGKEELEHDERTDLAVDRYVIENEV